MPARWALVYHQSRWGYSPDTQVESICQTFRVDFAVSDQATEVADCRDAVTGDADIGIEARRTRAIEDSGLADDQIAMQRHVLSCRTVSRDWETDHVPKQPP